MNDPLMNNFVLKTHLHSASYLLFPFFVNFKINKTDFRPAWMGVKAVLMISFGNKN